MLDTLSRYLVATRDARKRGVKGALVCPGVSPRWTAWRIGGPLDRRKLMRRTTSVALVALILVFHTLPLGSWLVRERTCGCHCPSWVKSCCCETSANRTQAQRPLWSKQAQCSGNCHCALGAPSPVSTLAAPQHPRQRIQVAVRVCLPVLGLQSPLNPSLGTSLYQRPPPFA